MSEKKKDEGGYELLQTKVSTKAAERLNRIARNRGTTAYGMIQLVCQFLIRTASEEYNLSDEINRLLTLFHLEPGWKDAYNSCDPTAETEIAQEILILQQPGRKGFGAMMINKPFMGAWTETECIDDIVIELRASYLFNYRNDLIEIHAFSVRTVGIHRVESIRYRDYPCNRRDLILNKTFRVASAVGTLVVGLGTRGELGNDCYML